MMMKFRYLFALMLLLSCMTYAVDLNAPTLIKLFHLDGYQVHYIDLQGNEITAAKFFRQFKALSVQPEYEGKLSISKESDEANKSAKLVMYVDNTEPKPAINVAVGKQLPNINGRNLLDKPTTLKTNQGHYSLITTFFSDCPACIEEAPAMNAFIKKHPDVSVYYVTYESAKLGRAFVKAHDIQADVIVDAMDWLQTVDVSGFPTNILLDAEGHVLVAESSYDPDDKLGFVERLLPSSN